MTTRSNTPGPCCGRVSRRTFLADMGMGFTGLALGAMLHRDGVSRAAEAAGTPAGTPHFPPKAKRVIWIFLSGGYSHLETFDPKPALNKYAGKTFDETPFANPLKSPLHDKRSRSVVADAINVRDTYPIVYPMQVGFKKHGQSGIEVSDWWPHLGDCVDDIAFVRSMWTTDNDHAAEFQFHTGRHASTRCSRPSARGSTTAWARSTRTCRSSSSWAAPPIPTTRPSVQSYYLGPDHAGVPLALDPTTRCRSAGAATGRRARSSGWNSTCSAS